MHRKLRAEARKKADKYTRTARAVSAVNLCLVCD
jgi:hypothetical protein